MTLEIGKDMRIIIAGSREGFYLPAVEDAMEQALRAWQWMICDVTVVSGTARGVDTLGEKWATDRGLPVVKYPANWAAYGKSAGYRRNAEMAENADALVALWDGVSKGTNHMITLALAKRLKVFVYGAGAGKHELYKKDTE